MNKNIRKIDIKIAFKIKGYNRDILRPETMKLLGSTKSKIIKNKNGENIPHFQIAEAVLVHCNIGNNYYQQN